MLFLPYKPPAAAVARSDGYMSLQTSENREHGFSERTPLKPPSTAASTTAACMRKAAMIVLMVARAGVGACVTPVRHRSGTVNG